MRIAEEKEQPHCRQDPPPQPAAVHRSHERGRVEAVILTEIMPTSLRRELEARDMPQGQITSIAQDVACALRYLHLWRPSQSSIVTSAAPMCYSSPSLMDGGQRFLTMALLIS